MATINWTDYIISNPDVLLGKPTIKGTRLSVEHLIGLFAQGWSQKQILDNYPRLTQASIQAVFEYLHDCLKDNLLYTDVILSEPDEVVSK